MLTFIILVKLDYITTVIATVIITPAHQTLRFLKIVSKIFYACEKRYKNIFIIIKHSKLRSHYHLELQFPFL